MSAAQDFLDKQLSKNRYTIKQQETLMSSGGPSAAVAGAGEVPGGEAYAKYGKMPSDDPSSETSTDSASTTSSAGSGDKFRGFGQDSDSGRNYSTGAWGSGDLDAEALASKYGLDRSNEARGEGHIWGRDASGNDVYIGKSSMDLASNKDLIANHSKQANPEEGDHSALGEDLSSSGDIKGAILTEWAGGNTDSGPKEEEEKERTPIEHSPEVQQAKERVATYENDVLSGKISEDIFGNGYNNSGLDLDTNTGDNNQPDVMQRINDKYSMDYNKGMEGIGTPSYEAPKSNEAAASFLNSKKSEYKSAYNFKPSAKIKYGAN